LIGEISVGKILNLCTRIVERIVEGTQVVLWGEAEVKAPELSMKLELFPRQDDPAEEIVGQRPAQAFDSRFLSL